MLFHLYDSNKKIIASCEADDIDLATDIFLDKASEELEIDCVSDDVTFLIGDRETFAVVVDGYDVSTLDD